MWFLSLQDCPFNYFEDEKLLCLWQNRSLVTHNSNTYFTCHNSLQIGFNQVCNGILNCANGEDEVFCRIADPPWNAAYSDRFLLDIDIYPQQLVPHVKQIRDQSLMHAVWYCNHGLRAYKGDSNNEFFFCPFYLYGYRC
ncbi:unnamed protein product [Rotaria socialis]|uniref:Uncharacterized protein n=1 Tax=Rotaria socialis TaxID=392032 RepID=A0A821IZW6_9BILA|nr:unnamed protein product [Rotaria socialis]